MENISHTTPRVRYCLYARKSTESDEKQALSIDSQINEMKQIVERLRLNIVCVKQESHSAKASGKRPVFAEIIKEITEEKYDGILTWAPDRLSRNAGDLGSLVDLMDQGKLIHIQTYGQTFSNSPNEKFLLMILDKDRLGIASSSFSLPVNLSSPSNIGPSTNFEFSNNSFLKSS